MGCYLETIDKSPNVEPPYCMYYGEDYDCQNCWLTEEEKDRFVREAEKAQDYISKQIETNKKKRRK